jgi:hypothetical protein
MFVLGDFLVVEWQMKDFCQFDKTANQGHNTDKRSELPISFTVAILGPVAT